MPPVSSVQALCRWVDSRLDCFEEALEADSALASVENCKPFVELCVLLYALTAPRHRRRNSLLLSWAERTARRLTDLAERKSAEVVGRRFHGTCQGRPRTSLVLLLYPLLGTAAQRQWQAQSAMRGFLRSIARQDTLAGHMDFHLLLDLFELGENTETTATHLYRTVLDHGNNPTEMSSVKLYDVTHDVFYATRFGRRPPDVLGAGLPWLRSNLSALALEWLLRGDYDVGAELVISHAYAQCEADEPFLRAVRMLDEAIPPDGNVPAPTRAVHASRSAFRNRYHTILVCLLALGEVSAFHPQT